MNDIEFVKLRFWLDAELAMMRIWLALIAGHLIDNRLVWIGLGIYILLSLVYAGVRLAYVEKKHKGYTQLPRP